MPYAPDNSYSSSSRSTSTIYYDSTGRAQPSKRSTTVTTTYTDSEGNKTTESHVNDSLGNKFTQLPYPLSPSQLPNVGIKTKEVGFI